jgi:hypothetical protein
MLSRTHRLDALTQRYPSQPERTPAFDVSGLTMEERFELDAILTKLEGMSTLPTGRLDLSPLSDAELERLDELAKGVRVPEAR